MGKRICRYTSLLWASLWFGLLGGSIGVLLDLDHILAYYGFRYQEGIFAGRPLHIPLAVIAGGLCVYSIARLRRRISRLVLENETK